MNPFAYEHVTDPGAALHAITPAGTKFLAGGTNLVDLMKDGVETPNRLVDINALPLAEVTKMPDGGVRIGALVRNSDLANNQMIVAEFPMLSLALLSGASAQLRNMATTGGNLLQRTRCYYFMDMTFPACNKREPGSGCAAIHGFNRIHAVLGQSDECIATNPSDMNVAMAALGATVQVEGPNGKRSIPFAEFHKLPGKTPQIETALKPDELIVAVDLPPSKFAKNYTYLKIRDRQSYAFALVSIAAGLEMDGGTVRSAALALGGVALKPWRKPEAEKVLVGQSASPATFTKAADILMEGAKGYEHNTFKIELAKRNIVHALNMAAQKGQA
jgi:xanthine dehydrogenase YagS FAD-binding subunit